MDTSTNLSESNFSVGSCVEINRNLITFRITVYVFLGSVICLVGFIGNILSIIVLRRDRDRKNTTTWLLQALAVADSLYLLASVLIQTLQTIKFDTNWWPAFTRIYPRARPYVWPIASIVQTTTVWIVLLITVDRYIAVTRPINTYIKKRKHTKVCVVLIFVAAGLYNIPRFFEKEVVTTFNHCKNRTEYNVVHTPFRLDRTYFLVYHVVLHCIFRTVGPLFVLLFLNVGLIWKFKRAQKTRNHLTGTAAHYASVTLMVITVVTVFIVCEFPDAMLRIVAVLLHDDPKEQRTNDTLLYLNVISNALLTLNSAVNFLMYCFTGTQFRKTVIRLCYHCDWKRRSKRESYLARTLSRETQLARTVSKDSQIVWATSHSDRRLHV